jgi:hypothetical protein
MSSEGRIDLRLTDVAEALIKQLDIHEGLSGIEVDFFAASATAGRTDHDLAPTALVKVSRIGLQRFDQPNNLSVDAAAVNPIKAA